VSFLLKLSKSELNEREDEVKEEKDRKYDQQKRSRTVVESWTNDYEWVECESVEGETKLSLLVISHLLNMKSSSIPEKDAAVIQKLETLLFPLSEFSLFRHEREAKIPREVYFC
jgi:hypothetical protein